MRATTRSLAALFVAVLFLFACGDDDDAQTESGASSQSDGSDSQDADDSDAGSDDGSDDAGDGEAASGVPSTLEEPCDVLDASEVEAIVGMPVTAENPSPGLSDLGGNCNYDPTPDDDGLYRVSYAVGDAAGGDPQSRQSEPGTDDYTFEELEIAGYPALRAEIDPEANYGQVQISYEVFGPGFNVMVDVQDFDDSPLVELAEAAVAALGG